MNKRQALCSQRGDDGLNVADYIRMEIRESEKCEVRAKEIMEDKLAKDGVAFSWVLWEDCLDEAAREIFDKEG